MKNSSPPPIGSVDKALQLLTIVQAQGSIGVLEASRMLRVAPSTAHRLLNALLRRDYVMQSTDNRYHPGTQLKSVSLQQRVLMLAHAAQEAVEGLSRAVEETVHLLVLEGPTARTITGAESRRQLRVTLDVGQRTPASAAAAGKAMLAELSIEELRTYYAGTIGSTRAMMAIERELAVVRERGYAFNEDETEAGVSALGVSLGKHLGEHVGIAITAPTSRFGPGTVEEWLPHLRAAQNQLLTQFTW